MVIIVAVVMALVVAIAQKKLFARYWNRRLDVKLRFAARSVQQGDRAVLQEIITNAKRLPLPTLQVKFTTSASLLFSRETNAVTTDLYYRMDLFSVGAGKKIVRELPFVASRRGYYQIDSLDVLARDYLLMSQCSERRANETSLYVYPAKVDTRAFDLIYRQMLGEQTARKRMEEDPFAFRGIRDYRGTDSMRRVNWKQSAAQGKLLVNLYESTSSQTVRLILDLSCHDTFHRRKVQEYCISLASSLAARLLHSGIAVSMDSNGCDVVDGRQICLPSGANRGHMESLDRALARIDLEQQTPDLMPQMKQWFEEDEGMAYTVWITAYFGEPQAAQMRQWRRDGVQIFAVVPFTVGHEPEAGDGVLPWEIRA